MKRCPECRKDYFDDSLMYCLDDGAPLVQGSVEAEHATALLPSIESDSDKATALHGNPPATDPELRSESRGRWGRARLAWTVAAMVAICLVASLVYIRFSPHQPQSQGGVVRFSIALPDKASVHINYDMHNLSVSPDGQHLAFVTNFEGQRKLWLRAIDALEAQVVPGSEGAYSPFWSPDSANIAFFAAGKLKRIDSSGKSLQTICDLSGEVETSGTWGSEGVILFNDNTDNANQLFRVPVSGGAPVAVPTGDKHLSRWPHFLPDGNHFLFSSWNPVDPATRGIHVGSLDSAETKLLLQTAPTLVEYAQGYLLFARDGSLLAQSFDEKTLRLSGEPITIVEHFPYFDQTGWAEFSVSDNGVLTYLIKRPAVRLVWLDRTGRETGQVGEPGLYEEVRLSPDGQKLAVTRSDERTTSGDIWIQDLTRDTAARFAFGPNDDSSGVWSPDGKRLAYFSCCEGVSTPQVMATLRVKEINDTGKGQTPLGPGFQVPDDWSLDGRSIVFTRSSDGNAKRNLWMLPTDGSGQATLFLETPFSEDDARFSPDGRWVMFTSDETGRNEIYVTRTEHPGEKWLVSKGGGRNAVWRRDGKEIFYLAPDKSLMSVTIKAGEPFASGTPVALFRNDSIHSFDVSADGQRFIASSGNGGGEAQSAPFGVVVNWTAELKHK
jgi:Tol biopolymer transport system component